MSSPYPSPNNSGVDENPKQQKVTSSSSDLLLNDVNNNCNNNEEQKRKDSSLVVVVAPTGSTSSSNNNKHLPDSPEEGEVMAESSPIKEVIATVGNNDNVDDEKIEEEERDIMTTSHDGTSSSGSDDEEEDGEIIETTDNIVPVVEQVHNDKDIIININDKTLKEEKVKTIKHTQVEKVVKEITNVIKTDLKEKENFVMNIDNVKDHKEKDEIVDEKEEEIEEEEDDDDDEEMEDKDESAESLHNNDTSNDDGTTNNQIGRIIESSSKMELERVSILQPCIVSTKATTTTITTTVQQQEDSLLLPVAVLAAPVVTVRESFLSDSLTEEERRTRTRYIPTVDGMHSLKKQEIKGDLLLARTLPGIITSTTSTTKSNNKGKQQPSSSSQRESPIDDDDIMDDIDNDETTSESARSKENSRSSIIDDDPSSRRILVGNTELIIPSSAFRPPPQAQKENINSDNTVDKVDTTTATNNKGGETNNNSSNNNTIIINNKRSSPREVESITAFNPPRLPESISIKKKHRIVRWQNTPTAMDVDLKIYYNTVQKTRDLLKNVELEYNKILTIDNHLRKHFLQHINNINNEMVLITQQINNEQKKCLKLTEWYLPTTNRASARSSSRTTTTDNNNNNSGYKAMKDIIHALRRLDIELKNKRDLLQINNPSKIINQSGVGGVSGISFIEGQRNTKVISCELASSWVIPNDKVIISSFGGIEGIVVKFFPYSLLDINEPPSDELFPNNKKQNIKHDRMIIDSSSPFGLSKMNTIPSTNNTSTFASSNQSNAAMGGPNNTATIKNQEQQKTVPNKTFILAPRFAVRLPFGVGFFSVNAVVSKEDPATYTNERLAERWKGLIETASEVAPTLDVGGMINKTAKEVNAAIQEYERSISSVDTREPIRVEDTTDVAPSVRRLVPFGASMLPTAVARGALLEKSTMSELNQNSSKLFNTGKGMLGNRENIGVTQEIRELEDQNQEYLNLQAKVLQLRNQLYRQRRIRILNEKTYNATKDRASRVESLVVEMRADLKTLKSRLDDEIRELGISDETAENILTSYYSSLDFQDSSGESPPRRKRRLTIPQQQPDNDEIMEDDGIPVDSSQ